MLKRYAIMIKDNEGRDVVSAISMMDGTTPQIRNDSSAWAERVSDAVQIGMIKGAPHNAVDGFGWDADHPNARPLPDNKKPRKDGGALDMVRATVA